MSKITPDDVRRVTGNATLAHGLIAAALNDPAIRRLVVGACLQHWWPTDSTAQCEEELYGTQAAILDALCDPTPEDAP